MLLIVVLSKAKVVSAPAIVVEQSRQCCNKSVKKPFKDAYSVSM